MKNIRVSILVVSGACDRAIPTRYLESEIVRRIPETRMAIVPDAGHLLPLEAHATTADLIMKASAFD
jgi:pimeloyl-ACP methyl ester carboxylesterase